MGDQTKETLGKGKEAAKKLEVNALKIRDDVQQKVGEFQKAVREVQEAQDAISTLLGSNQSSSDVPFDLCTVDEDCILVSYEGCCSSVISINRSFVSKYNAHPEWSGKNNTPSCVQERCLGMFDENSLPVCQSDGDGKKRCGLMPPP